METPNGYEVRPLASNVTWKNSSPDWLSDDEMLVRSDFEIVLPVNCDWDAFVSRLLYYVHDVAEVFGGAVEVASFYPKDEE